MASQSIAQSPRGAPTSEPTIDFENAQFKRELARPHTLSVDTMKKLMRKIALVILFAALPSWLAAQPPDQPHKAAPKPGTDRRAGHNSCAKYGPGFVKVQGSDMCIKIGGGVSVEGGGSMRR